MKWPFATKQEEIVPEKDPTSLGKLLVDHELISQEELEFALHRQHEAKDELLGAILVKEGLIEEGMVEAMLVIQKAKRGNGKDLKAAVEYLSVQNNLISAEHKSLRNVLDIIRSQHLKKAAS